MTGWSWEEAGELDIPRFSHLSQAWGRVGPLAPYMPKEGEGDPGPSSPLPEDPQKHAERDPLGFLMQHPEMLPHG